jgi:hypothetical protein
MMRALVAAFVGLMVLAGSAEAATAWKITKDHWSEEDEKGFSEFVTALGESGCSTTEDCFENHLNPFRDSDPNSLVLDGDCADLPYQMRAYYAWKNGLPFSYAVGVSPRQGSAGDLRFNTKGNKVVARRDVLPWAGGFNAISFLHSIGDAVSSATFRVSHEFDSGASVSDFYSPKIQKGSIRPGTVIYDINGHVVVVYKVDQDGRVHYMDSHPDRTLTRSTFGAQFARDDPGLGSGFKNFRPVRLVGYTKASDGSLKGGKLVFAKNEDIPDYSPEQYYGNEPDGSQNWAAGKFMQAGVQVGFYEWVRLQLGDGKNVYNPIFELRNGIRSICGDLKDRVQAVDIAIGDKIHLKAQPARLPNNIYGTDSMEWEIYSTPSRDARLKTRFKELRDNVAKLIDMYNNRDPRVSYDGLQLKETLQKIYDDESAACKIRYRNTNGKEVTLSFDDVRKRLFKLSFDNYHCIERRWGATEDDELESCDDGGEKKRWYEAEQRLRNQIDRTYDTPMNFSLSDLRNKKKGSGWDEPPDVDVKKVIDTMGPRKKFEGMKPTGL